MRIADYIQHVHIVNSIKCLHHASNLQCVYKLHNLNSVHNVLYSHTVTFDVSEASEVAKLWPTILENGAYSASRSSRKS